MKNLIKILTLVTALILLSSCYNANETNDNVTCNTTSVCVDSCKSVDSTSVSKEVTAPTGH